MLGGGSCWTVCLACTLFPCFAYTVKGPMMRGVSSIVATVSPRPMGSLHPPTPPKHAERQAAHAGLQTNCEIFQLLGQMWSRLYGFEIFADPSHRSS
ncbi:hypothetical protein PF005_g966 [Phytophthora fragariae]|uniref:Secreted protein n=1 Tax=Phytophthora fragariae TaxID=53985 RepID=A0A6A4AAK5_9STRA|nr:hypothetical protein PF003_g27090 [Phytophthora fragariae]KAE8941130.1 hypothetical protein PF009_g9078 [Phytophthora fragariae]KAE9029143.1 hypothetical protein PF011_g1208 [Phytophthora fragariae]KAE9119549.1 hypothetical protein PF007_g8502 [Phytophthora fragariae]KAE9137166.1 hypothetical protein PF010_g1431 [Phytophthora fragariae]